MAADNIKVAVRVRPLLKHELDAGHKSCLLARSSDAQVAINGPTAKETFSFTHVFSATQTDQSVYDSAVKPLLPSLFKGYNVTVLAYGQTGSGKTHSMGTSCGTEGGNPQGIIPRSVEEIFDRIMSASDTDYTVSVTFLELYNEQIRDLIQNSTQPDVVPTSLDVREDPVLGVCIPGLSSQQVQSAQQILDILAMASQFRSTGATAMNKMSSRSHAVFTLKIESLPRDGSKPTVAKFCLVDLAGSERAKKTQSTGERFKEGVNINMGLLALGNVISALGNEEGRRNHIPYRDSKLTRLLQDRALKIKNKPTINTDLKAVEMEALKAQLAHIQQLLTLERSKSFKRCPPGHQRLLDIAKGELNVEGDTTFKSRMRATSPRTKNYLRQVGIPFDSDEEELDDGLGMTGALIGCDNDDDEGPTNRLFPALPDLRSPGQEEDEPDYVATEELHYQEHLKRLDSDLEDIERQMKDKEAEVKELDNNSLHEVEEKLFELQEMACRAEKATNKGFGKEDYSAKQATCRFNLKQLRVRLSREIKKSGENFRQWKQRQDREVGRLQEAERKGRNKLDQQAKTFAVQQSVLQRKYQEAMAHIKRLQAQRRPQATSGNTHTMDRLEMWLDRELENERSLVVTRDALDQLVAERTRLQEKAYEMKATKTWEDRATRKKRLNETRIIQNQITLQDTDVKSSNARWAGVTNLGEARFLLSSLFTKLINSEAEVAARNERAVELEEAQIKLNQQVKEMSQQIKEMQVELNAKNDMAVMPPPPTPRAPCTPEGHSVVRPPAVSSVLKNRKSLFINPGLSDDEDTSINDDNDDDKNDPDWNVSQASIIEESPMAIKQRNSRETKKRSGSSEHSKKFNDSNRCSCKGNCSNRRCLCVKSGEDCSSENCKCAADQCKNRSTTPEANSPDNVLGETFILDSSTPNENKLHLSSLKRESSEISDYVDDAEAESPKKQRLFE
ncbi:hypothetical protein B566_EDAN015184 [Ephemera danica]|nr:hypothetical protein B566_EDAN015184 [Ephemera danica]